MTELSHKLRHFENTFWRQFDSTREWRWFNECFPVEHNWIRCRHTLTFSIAFSLKSKFIFSTRFSTAFHKFFILHTRWLFSLKSAKFSTQTFSLHLKVFFFFIAEYKKNCFSFVQLCTRVRGKPSYHRQSSIATDYGVKKKAIFNSPASSFCIRNDKSP